MSVIKLASYAKCYEWGGQALRAFGVTQEGPIAQQWELRVNSENPSVVVTGCWAGQTLKRYIEENPDKAGTLAKAYPYFPISIVLVDNQKPSMIQVDPDPEKIQALYILSAKKDGCVYCGFDAAMTRDELVSHVEQGTLGSLIRPVPVQAGDALVIEPGTVYAIGADVQYLAVQQDAPLRSFSFAQVLDAVRLQGAALQKEADRQIVGDGQANTTLLADTDVFAMFRTVCDGEVTIHQDADSFGSIVVLEGSAVITHEDSIVHAQKGDSIWIDAGTRDVRLVGNCVYVYTVLTQ
ncbi:hypothetical protein [uncultured Dubosiella sp.]|uniref:hypothetical protein n=1 Tax=uncultured Dubosiella sp. TaxID=1937011 RepID=UPI002731BF64|nr:hypothetical protein [uncultured Dubosiella sp.]